MTFLTDSMVIQRLILESPLNSFKHQSTLSHMLINSELYFFQTLFTKGYPMMKYNEHYRNCGFSLRIRKPFWQMEFHQNAYGTLKYNILLTLFFQSIMH